MNNLLLGVIVFAHPTTPARLSVCDNTHDRAVVLMASVRAEMHETGQVHPGINWQQTDTATLRPVTNDSLCQVALETIQKYMDRNLEPKGITLIYAGPYVVAQQIERTPGSEFTMRYILDDSFQHVLYPCPNGYAPSPDGSCPRRKANSSP